MNRYEIVVEGSPGRLVQMAAEGSEVESVGGGRSPLVGGVVARAFLHAVLRRLDDIHVSMIDVHRSSEPAPVGLPATRHDPRVSAKIVRYVI